MAHGRKPFLGLRGTKLDIAVITVAGVDMLLFGYDQGVTGGLLSLPSFTAVFPEICTRADCTSDLSPWAKHNRSVIQGIVVSCFSLGSFFGNIFLVRFGNTLGRKRCIMSGCFLMIVGAILQFASYGIAQFVVGRLVCGFGNGFVTATVPVWQAECSRPNRRGVSIALDMGLNLAGVMVAYWVNFGMSSTEPSSVAWRFPIALQILFAGFIICSIYFLPESPRWLVLKGREKDACEVLEALNDVPPDDASVSSQIQAMRGVTNTMTTDFSQVFTNGPTKNFQRACLAYWMQVCQQLTGINVITYYTTTIYEQFIGLSPFTARLLAGFTATAYFLSAIPAIFTIERCGRRVLLMTGSFGMMVSMAVMAIMIRYDSYATGIVAAAFIFVYQLFFASTWSPSSWIYPAEIVPLSIRVQANALAVSANWLVAFMVVTVTPIMFESIGYQTYIVFAVLNAATIPVIYFLYPETAYRSLEEMDVIFSKSNGVMDAVRVAQTEPRHFDNKGRMIGDVGADVERNAGDIIIDAEKSEEPDATVHAEHIADAMKTKTAV